MFTASYLNAGTIAVLLAADRAPERAPRDAFHVEEAGRLFHEAGRRLLMPYFWLINLYALVLLLLLAVVFEPMLLLLAGITSGNSAPRRRRRRSLRSLPSGFFFAGAITAHLVFLASARALVAEGVGALEGVGRGFARLRETAARSVGLYFLTIAIGMGVGAVVSMPRFFLTFFTSGSDSSPLAFLPLILVLVGIEIVVAAIWSLVVTGSFVSLWSEEVPRRASAARVLPAAGPARGGAARSRARAVRSGAAARSCASADASAVARADAARCARAAAVRGGP